MSLWIFCLSRLLCLRLTSSISRLCLLTFLAFIIRTIAACKYIFLSLSTDVWVWATSCNEKWKSWLIWRLLSTSSRFLYPTLHFCYQTTSGYMIFVLGLHTSWKYEKGLIFHSNFTILTFIQTPNHGKAGMEYNIALWHQHGIWIHDNEDS